MFKYIYNYFYNLTDTPYNQHKLNMWSFVNIRFNKIKITNQLVFFVSTLTSIQQNFIKVFHKSFTFHNFYFVYFYLTLAYVFLFIILL